MAAVTELATAVGTRAACRALFAPRASYYRDRRAASFPAATALRPRPARALSPEERKTVLDSSSRRTVPGSLPSRCLCDVAR